MKILLIDDYDLVLYTLSRVLRRNGDIVITASNGDLGMSAFRRERPDLVITDIIMPEQEGLGTIVKIRRDSPEAKIIAISGGGRVGNVDVLEAARALGVNDLIAKPFEPEELVARVRRIADGSGSSDGSRDDLGTALRRLASRARDPSHSTQQK
jgi:DNA-binding response OmpR family regulator